MIVDGEEDLLIGNVREDIYSGNHIGKVTLNQNGINLVKNVYSNEDIYEVKEDKIIDAYTREIKDGQYQDLVCKVKLVSNTRTLINAYIKD